MNNPSILSIIYWQTRNWRHIKKAEQLCKNYGLNKYARNFYIGKVKNKETKIIRHHLKEIFSTKSEKFFILQICKNCLIKNKFLQKEEKNLHLPNFKII